MKILKRLRDFQLSISKKRKKQYEKMIATRCNNKKAKLKEVAHDTLAN